MSDATRRVLDTAALATAIETVRRHRGINGIQVSQETGLCRSTLKRIGNGQKPDADALVTILAWLKADVAQFTREREEDQP